MEQHSLFNISNELPEISCFSPIFAVLKAITN